MSREIKKILQLVAYCTLAIIFLSQGIGAQESTVVATDIIGGEIGAISNNFISIIYSKDEQKGTEEELALPIPKDVKIQHKKSVHEIKTGDIVEVEYELTKKDGKVISRKVKVITFLRPAQREIVETTLPVQKDKEGNIWELEKRDIQRVTW